MLCLISVDFGLRNPREPGSYQTQQRVGQQGTCQRYEPKRSDIFDSSGIFLSQVQGVPIICSTQKCNKQGVSKIRISWASMRAQAEEQREAQCAALIIPQHVTQFQGAAPWATKLPGLLFLRSGRVPRISAFYFCSKHFILRNSHVNLLRSRNSLKHVDPSNTTVFTEDNCIIKEKMSDRK